MMDERRSPCGCEPLLFGRCYLVSIGDLYAWVRECPECGATWLDDDVGALDQAEYAMQDAG